jgi:hypothetical protein
MKNTHGMALRKLIVIIALFAVALMLIKYQTNKDQQPHSQINAENQRQAEAIHLAEIEKKKADDDARAREIEAQLLDEMRQRSIGDQTDLTSPTLPLLPWKEVPSHLTKIELSELEKRTKGMVISTLKDPESAKFKDTKAITVMYHGGRQTFICGMVNAKNSFGGYTGFQPYIFHIGNDQKIDGGIGDKGSISAKFVDQKWWKFDGDDACFSQGAPFQ